MRSNGDYWYRREGETLVVGCNSTADTWFLVCKDTQWFGEIGNCTTSSTVISGWSSNRHKYMQILRPAHTRWNTAKINLFEPVHYFIKTVVSCVFKRVECGRRWKADQLNERRSTIQIIFGHQFSSRFLYIVKCSSVITSRLINVSQQSSYGRFRSNGPVRGLSFRSEPAIIDHWNTSQCYRLLIPNCSSAVNCNVLPILHNCHAVRLWL